MPKKSPWSRVTKCWRQLYQAIHTTTADLPSPDWWRPGLSKAEERMWAAGSRWPRPEGVCLGPEWRPVTEADTFTPFTLRGRDRITAAELGVILAGGDPNAPWWRGARLDLMLECGRGALRNLVRDIRYGKIYPLALGYDKFGNRDLSSDIIDINDADAFVRRIGGAERWDALWAECKAAEPQTNSELGPKTTQPRNETSIKAAADSEPQPGDVNMCRRSNEVRPDIKEAAKALWWKDGRLNFKGPWKGRCKDIEHHLNW